MMDYAQRLVWETEGRQGAAERGWLGEEAQREEIARQQHEYESYMERQMEDTKHTPGPWRPDGAWIRAHQAPHRQGICKMLYIPVDQYEPELNWVVTANARLIAAAPEMFEALEEVIRKCDQFKNNGANANDYRHVQSIAETARAALAEAGDIHS